MTTSIPSPIRKPISRPARGAFTLVEVIIGSTLSSFILAAVLSTFVFMARSGVNLTNYSDMESQARKALEIFAEDVRQASAINWTSSTNVTLSVNSASIVYYFDSSDSQNLKFFRRTSTGSTALITKITAGTFSFTAYNVNGTPLPLVTSANLTAATTSTKQLQISLEASRSNGEDARQVKASNLVLSARYILRNKIVTA